MLLHLTWILLLTFVILCRVFRNALGKQVALFLGLVAAVAALGVATYAFSNGNSFAFLIGLYLMALAGAGAFFAFIEFAILRIFGLFRLGAITRITYYEALLQPFTLIIITLGIAAITIFSFLPYFTINEDFKMYRDVAISLTFLFTLPVMVFASTKVIDEEIENRTMLTLMSKPISRWQVIIGKYFGVVLLCLGIITALGIIAGTCAYLRYFDDNRIDYFTARTLDEMNILNLNNTKAVLAIIPAVLMQFLQIAMLAAVCVAVSTRWGLAVNITITVLLYVGANLARYAITFDLPVPLSWLVIAISHLLPNLALLDLNQRLVYGNFNLGDQYWARNTPSYGQIWQYVGISTAYALFYISGILSIGIAMFRTRELT